MKPPHVSLSAIARDCLRGVSLIVAIVAGAAAAPAAGPLTLWYERPAAQWVEALPVGNGRLGAMVFGGIEQERLQLNEDTLWAGGPYHAANPEARAALPEVRRLIAAGEYRAAQDLVQAKFMAVPMRQMPYQTIGDLLVTMGGSETAQNYRRELDLDTAVARTEFQMGNTVHVREVFASAVDQVIVVRLSAREAQQPDRPARISFSLGFQSRQDAGISVDGGATLVLRGVNGGAENIPGALTFEARARVLTEGGSIRASAGQLHVDGASSATILIAAATSFRRYDDVSGDPAALTTATLARAGAKTFDALRADHVSDHQRLFRRVAIDLGRNPAAEALPTDARVRQSPQVDDPGLAALYFQYGRYLLIGSSRPGTQPANLQGLWNDHLYPPWGSKYTININTEMNYWPAEVTNLAECTEPLFGMIRDLSQTGARMAKDHYGAPGWVTHHNTDLWRAAGPIDGPFWGMWPTGGAWLSLHLWEHYRFSGDREFLAQAYPLMRGAAEFFLATLVEEPKHRWLVTSPSISPENAHHDGVSITAGPTMDNQILRDLFTACIDSAGLLGTDAEFSAKLVAARDRLPPNQIGAQGQLMEWLEDWDAGAPEQQHRHVSHLYGFYPSSQITLRGTPDLARAVKTTLEARGDISTGWAIAWRLNLWARLQDGNRTHRILRALLGPERTYPNLFDAHPPFQIDGNLGGAAGIAEMLLQSHVPATVGGASGEKDRVFEIELLPALPDAWPTGSVSGLRARGGFEVAITWKDGRLVAADLHAPKGGRALLRYGAMTRELILKPGTSFTWDGK
ncbi:MAG: glycoside hydrolase family 95 protein [Opitutaceae bacterium]|nr:glycoside hydrolase family 95 protein [Opitutaceae bacterium]